MDKIRYFFDFEFATKNAHEKDEILSVGLMITKGFDPEPIFSYYSVAKLANEKEINPYSMMICGISLEEMRRGKDFTAIMQELDQIIKAYPTDEYYTWGDTDAVVYKNSVEFTKEKGPASKLWDQFIDFQKIFGKSIVFEDGTYNAIWSLQDAKSFCRFEGEVQHNALEDARDLKDIFMAYQMKKELDWEKIEAREEKIKSCGFYPGFRNINGEELVNPLKKKEQIKWGRFYEHLNKKAWIEIMSHIVEMKKQIIWQRKIGFAYKGVKNNVNELIADRGDVSLVVTDYMKNHIDYIQITLRNNKTKELISKGRMRKSETAAKRINQMLLALEEKNA